MVAFANPKTSPRGADNTLSSSTFSRRLRFETNAQHSEQPDHFKFPEPELKYYRGIGYASCSEAACGTMLEKYIPGFRVVEGRSFQIAVHPHWSPNPKSIDFFVEGAFLEFHPPRFWRDGGKFGDFRSAGEYFKFRRAIKRCRSAHEKALLKEEMREELTESYYRKRKGVIEGDPSTKGTELIVASSAGDLYDKVIRRFSSNPPSRKRFLAEFDAIVDDVVHANDKYASRKASSRFQGKRAA